MQIGTEIVSLTFFHIDSSHEGKSFLKPGVSLPS